MAKTLVAYFSASNVTKKVATDIASLCEADLFEIEPAVAYTKEDLDWTNKESRSSVEMADPSCRPAVKSKVCCIENYDIIMVGFPVWWNREPSVVDTFLEENDMTGKKLVVFCTSGSSDASGSVASISALVKDKACVVDGGRLAADISCCDLKAWAEKLPL